MLLNVVSHLKILSHSSCVYSIVSCVNVTPDENRSTKKKYYPIRIKAVFHWWNVVGIHYLFVTCDLMACVFSEIQHYTEQSWEQSWVPGDLQYNKNLIRCHTLNVYFEKEKKNTQNNVCVKHPFIVYIKQWVSEREIESEWECARQLDHKRHSDVEKWDAEGKKELRSNR